MPSTSITADKLRQNSYITIGSIPFDGLFGNSDVVAVIKDGKAQTRTVGYFLGASFYTGPKTQLANGRWVTGDVQDESSQFLLERNVPNMQVIDNRDIWSTQAAALGALINDDIPPLDLHTIRIFRVLYN